MYRYFFTSLLIFIVTLVGFNFSAVQAIPAQVGHTSQTEISDRYFRHYNRSHYRPFHRYPNHTYYRYTVPSYGRYYYSAPYSYYYNNPYYYNRGSGLYFYFGL